MDNKLLTINIIYAITDTIIAALAIVAFAWGAWFFGKWWMLCFCIIPLGLFNSHSVIISADIAAARKGEADGKS